VRAQRAHARARLRAAVSWSRCDRGHEPSERRLDDGGLGRAVGADHATHEAVSGTGFSLKIKQRADAKEASSVDLYHELHEVIADNVRALAKGKSYRHVTPDNVELTIDDGAGRPTEIAFGFHDSGGLVSGSMHACYHWFELLVSALARTTGKTPSPLEEIVRRHGFTLDDKVPPLASLLRACRDPLVEIRGHTYGTGWFAKGKPMLIGDELDDEDRIEFEDLEPAERTKVRTALEKKHCSCVVCVKLRSKKTKLRLPKVKAKKPPKLGIKTDLNDDKTYRSITDDKCETLPDAVFGPPTLTSLHVSAPIADLPDAVTRLDKLERLSLYNTKLTRIPDALTRMPSLRRLSLFRGRIAEARELERLSGLHELSLSQTTDLARGLDDVRFEGFEELTSLELYGLNLPHLPKGLSRLSALRELSINDDELKTLPDVLGKLAKLEKLSLTLPKLRALPRVLASLPALRELTLSCDGLTSLDDRALPRGLTKLSIDGSNLTSLPESLGSVTGLVELTLGHSKVDELPASLAKLTALADLTLDGSALDKVPAVVGKLSALRQLSLYGVPALDEGALPKSLTRLTIVGCSSDVLPKSLATLTNLEDLMVCRTKLTAVPDSIRKLRKLTTLDLARNEELAELPAWLGELTRLESLSLRDLPKVKQLPATLGKLTKMTRLNLDETKAPVGDWVAKLPLEELSLRASGTSRERQARLKKLLPKTKIVFR